MTTTICVPLHSSKHCISFTVNIICFLSSFRLQRVKQVIGIEMCKEALQDARANAELNGKNSWGDILVEYMRIEYA